MHGLHLIICETDPPCLVDESLYQYMVVRTARNEVPCPIRYCDPLLLPFRIPNHHLPIRSHFVRTEPVRILFLHPYNYYPYTNFLIRLCPIVLCPFIALAPCVEEYCVAETLPVPRLPFTLLVSPVCVPVQTPPSSLPASPILNHVPMLPFSLFLHPPCMYCYDHQ